jgi:membrane associated rhomboid family serine protease
MAVAVKEGQQEVAAGEGAPARVEAIRDGSIDFSRYSVEQLSELQFTLDRSAFPLNYANLLAELARRTAAPPAVTPEVPSDTNAAVLVRFTAHDRLRGWLEAKSRRLALYGEGFVEVRAQEVALGGWHRNWLGVAQRTEVFIPLHAITDVIQGSGGSGEECREADWVRFRYEEASGRYRFVEFQAASIEQSRNLVEALPKARSDGYERWTAVREFDARLREVGARPWITSAVVFANVVIFVATALALKRVDLSAAPQMITWGANFAPLTLHGQWWRLLSALFLHGNIAHVFFNMWALWNVGRLTEHLYGNWAFAFLYLACGVLSGLASIVWDPSRATIGASGAIFGIFAAVIVFSLHPRIRGAVKVPAALWVSTLVFALYNLAAGFFYPGVDNAAHVGGVLSGVILGACLVRPLDLKVRSRFPVKNMVVATVLATIAGVAAVWQATGLGDQLTAPERYVRTHLWYVNGEVENLRKWQEIALQAGSGQLSNAALSERFQREIVPFWEDASARLKKDEAAVPADERQYASLAAEYSRLRLQWANAVVDGARGNQERFSDAAGLSQQETGSPGSVGNVLSCRHPSAEAHRGETRSRTALPHGRLPVARPRSYSCPGTIWRWTTCWSSLPTRSRTCRMAARAWMASSGGYRFCWIMGGMYWSYSSLEDDKVALFNRPLAVWSTMREGFEELQRKYPQSDFILNAYAKFACMADDGASYADVRPKLRDRLSSVAWSEKVSLKYCDEQFPAAAAAARGHTFTPPKLR